MKIKHLDLTTDIDQDKPFKNCKLDREKYAEVLTNIVSSYSDGFVLAINNKWGTGKTTFVKMWEKSLENKGFQTVYFNAWENDFENNPLTALMGELMVLSEESKKDFDNLLKKGATITKHIAPIIVKAVADKYIDIDSLKNALVGLSKGMANVFEDDVKEYAKKKENIADFRASLEKFIAKSIVKKPLIFIVDELDRCRPNYAVSILEQIKHLFSIPNIVFVLSIDKEQLGNAVRGVYGSDKIDADEYLRRFIDLEYSLPIPSEGVFYKYLYDYFKFDEFFESSARNRRKSHYEIKSQFLKYCDIIFLNNNISLRVQEKIFGLIRTSLRSVDHHDYIIPQLLLLLVYIKIVDNEFYNKLKNKELSFIDAQKGFLKTLLHSKNEETENLLIYLEAYFVNSYNLYTRDRLGRSELFKYDKETNREICTISSVVNENLNDEFHRHLEHHSRFNNYAYNLEFMLDRIDLLVNLKD